MIAFRDERSTQQDKCIMSKSVLNAIAWVWVFCAIAVKAQDYQDYQENVRPSSAAKYRQSTSATEQTRAAPIAILKQINKHNEDGSYTYGFEGADGSFKIETKLATGEVKGKYGYVDATGKVRVVEYGANKYGFQPSGEGITVAPLTLVDDSKEREEEDYDNEPPVKPHRPQRVHRPQVQYRSAPTQPPPRRAQPQYVQYEDEEAEAEPEPPRSQLYTSAPKTVAPPAPARIQVTGAHRTPETVYTAAQKPTRIDYGYTQSTSFGDTPSAVRVSRPIYAPAPAPPSPSSARAHGFLGPASGGRPLLESFQFAPNTAPTTRPVQAPQQPHQQQQQQYAVTQVRFQPHLQGRSSSGDSGSLLDQLARDYALPQSSAQPLHDISFGYY